MKGKGQEKENNDCEEENTRKGMKRKNVDRKTKTSHYITHIGKD